MSKQPKLPLEWISTEPRHIEAFGHKHPLEASVITGITLEDDGFHVHSVERYETYTLESELIAPFPLRINITQLKASIFAGKTKFDMVRCTNSQEWHDYIFESCGCEEEHIGCLTLEDLKRPAIMIYWDPQLHMTSTVDGAHRICRRWREGIKDFEVAFVSLPEAAKFIQPMEKKDG